MKKILVEFTEQEYKDYVNVRKQLENMTSGDGFMLKTVNSSYDGMYDYYAFYNSPNDAIDELKEQIRETRLENQRLRSEIWEYKHLTLLQRIFNKK